MLKPKRFIGISARRYNGRLVMLSSSEGQRLYRESGLYPLEALDFLFDLIYLRRSDATTVFVSYASSIDNEFLFSGLERYTKDKLFQSEQIRKQIFELENENEGMDDILYTKNSESLEYAHADFNKHVNKLSLAELKDVRFGPYKIELVNGKSLTIYKEKKKIIIYDICGFFGKPAISLRKAVKKWLDKDLVYLDQQALENLNVSLREKHALFCVLEATATAQLAQKLNTSLLSAGINISRFHGATAVSSFWLGRLQAKQEYYNYRYRRQLSPELHKAVRQANYGGRSEQFKIGTLQDVYVYDINSAYAYASSFLPVMVSKPSYSRDYQPDSAFSLWFCEYDFRDVNPYFGYLPNRDPNNVTRYKLKGSGYFWQPEVDYVLRHHPECINVTKGFVLGYERADFAKAIPAIYDARLELQRRGDPLEKVFKLALASIYGKFCQHNGRGYYYNLFYAGFITSLVRMMMLEATKGNERETITFQTDSIHSLSNSLNVNVGSGLGEYKLKTYQNVTYIDNGCYVGHGDTVTSKNRGFRQIDFHKALSELQQGKTYTALAEFFVGHNLHSSNMFSGAEYLSHYAQSKTNSPLAADSANRLFEVLDIDLTKSYFDSKPLQNYSGRESSLYRETDYKGTDMALEAIEAGRV